MVAVTIPNTLNLLAIKANTVTLARTTTLQGRGEHVTRLSEYVTR